MARDAKAPAARRILVVDDNKDVARSLELGLELLGHTVAIAHDAHDALRLVGRFAPDVAIVDVELPTMSGYELAAQLRAQRAIRVITVSGYASALDPADAERTGIVGHVVKPIDLHALAQLVSS